jgi:cytochrome P450
MDMVGMALLGSDLGADAAQVREAVKVGQEHVNWRITHLFSLPERYPTPRNRRFHQALRTLDNVVYSIIDRRREVPASPERAEGASGHDLLTLLLEARDDETGEGMTDDQVRDEVMTIFLAGHETTANALAWAWHLLSSHPEIEEHLHQEVDSVLSGRSPGFGDIAHLKYTRMVIDETLRLFPPVWAIARFPVRNDEAGGYGIPAYSQVILSPYVTHRHADFWEEPERFDPERFLPDRIAQRPKYAYFPFGGGPRMCIGSEFALMEGVLALATIAGQYRLRPVPNHKVEPEPLITLRPKGGLPMYIEPRGKH